jgi:hypothetical protein
MYFCGLLVYLPIVLTQRIDDPLSFRVAEFNFDPGLFIKDEVFLKDASLTNTRDKDGKRIISDDRLFSFNSIVTGSKVFSRKKF